MIPLLPPAQVEAAPAPTPAPEPRPLRAQYGWGYVGDDGEGKGTLAVLVEPASGRVVIEIQGLGERLALIQGNRAEGYRLQIPRDKVDERAATLDALPLPFLPRLGGPEALQRLLEQGEGPGVDVRKRDAQGPVKLHYRGKDDRGKDVEVWLTRERWEK